MYCANSGDSFRITKVTSLQRAMLFPARVARPVSVALVPFSKTIVASGKSRKIYIFQEVEALRLDFPGLDRHKAGTQTDIIK
jgi:hypothetical protein